MNRAMLACAGVALIAAAGAGLVAAAVAAAESPPPLYYQDPDGKPDYSPTPKKTSDGRDYIAVPADADAGSDKASAPASASADRKIKFYRNPMGLPDTSPVPKKDSMGMDYIAVYEGEDTDDGAVRLSPGKIQRSGVKSEPAARRVIRTAIRAPGTIQLDERRVSVISMRSESFILNVADVTTGSHVAKGQRLMEVYSPAIASAAAEYIATINSKTTAGDGLYGRGSRQRLINLDVPDAAIAAIEKTRNVPISVEWDSPRDGIVRERRAIEGISQKRLTQNLRRLERDGIVTRTVYAEVPPRVEYTLTPLGSTLCVPITAIRDWAGTHIESILDAQTRYDGKG